MKLLKSAIGIVIEGFIHQALRADRDAPLLLETIRDKRLAVHINDFSLRFVFIGEAEGIRVSVNDYAKADAEITGDLVDLMKLGFATTPQAVLASDKVDLKGEVSVLQAYQKFMGQLDIDWEGRLSEIIGPIAAAEMGKLAKKAKQFWKDDIKSTTHDISEYLTEELKVCPPREEVEDFYEDVTKLKQDVDRFDLKLKRSL